MTAPVDPDQPSADATVVDVMARAIDQVDFQDPRVQARAALIALQEAGFVVVPREPTEAMVAAAEATGDHWYFDESWAAMIAASEPSHPKDSP